MLYMFLFSIKTPTNIFLLIRTASLRLLYLEHLSLCYLPQVVPFAYPACVSCCSPIVLSLRR